MTNKLQVANKIEKEQTFDFTFSICTLVTKKTEYQEMLNSFEYKGFTSDLCEFLYIDNSENCTFDAYEGLNVFLQKAKGKYVILCHQDIIIHDQNKDDLLKLIIEIDKKDENWGILGNAGGVNIKWRTNHITQGEGNTITEKNVPLKVRSLDENFILVKKSANLALSRNLNGFHLYGTDICLIAEILGYNSYVIGFNLLHKSNGTIDKSFFDSKKNLLKKYNNALRTRFMSSTISRFCLTGNPFFQVLYNSKIILYLVRQYYKLTTKTEDYKLK